MRFPALAFLAALFLPVHAARAQVPDNHWPLTVNCQDVIAGQDCAASGGSFTGGGLRFGGGNAVMPAGLLDGLTAFTLIWNHLVPATPTQDGRVIDSGGGDGGNPGITLNLKKNQAGRIMTQINAADGNDNLVCDGMYSLGVRVRLAISFEAATGELRCYRDGAFAAAPVYSPRSVATHTRAPMIGDRGTGGRQFQGTIGEMKLYRRVLSAAEVAAEFGAPPPANTPPQVSIAAPAGGQVFDVLDVIAFQATASDLEDGDLTASLSWSSNIDGFLGLGGSFSLMLTEGSHAVTAGATDSGMATGADTVNITVTPGAPPPSASPYAPSDIFAGIVFNQGSIVTLAPGSDNWPITWSDDGHQYTIWGDGGGFGGTNSQGRVSLGVARVEGPHDAYAGFNVWGGNNPENLAQFPGKSYGIISIGGVLHAWLGQGGDNSLGSVAETKIMVSLDKGASWSVTPTFWTSADDLYLPSFLNYGQDNAGAGTYVYSYFPRGSTFAMHKPGRADLARVPEAMIEDPSAYEWFAGLDANGDPVWTFDLAMRQPVFEDPEGLMTVSVAYVPQLDRYLLTTDHGAAFDGRLGVFEGPAPWGPWRTVFYTDTPWLGQGGTISYYFAPAWWRAGGLEGALVYTESDGWRSIDFRLVLSDCAWVVTYPECN